MNRIRKIGASAIVALTLWFMSIENAVAGDDIPQCIGANVTCFAVHGTVGCDDLDCCNLVCTIDQFCCLNEWDATCVGHAINACGDPSCVSATGDCYIEGGNGTAGCDDPACCNTVCAIDAFCCSSSWDAACAFEAGQYCGPVGRCCYTEPSPGDIAKNEGGPTCGPDGIVDTFDILQVLNEWTTTGVCGDIAGDGILFPDGIVDTFDLLAVLNLWNEDDSQCGDFAEGQCAQLQGTWNGDAFCTVDCEDIVGRCCYSESNVRAGAGVLCSVENESDCDALGGIWDEGDECTNGCPVGRCCYNDGAAPACIDVTEYECDVVLDGIWDEQLNCVDDLCPLPNDECEGSLPAFLGPNPFTLTTATHSGQPACIDVFPFGNNEINNDVWFYYVVPHNGVLFVDTCGDTNFDTRLAVYVNPIVCPTVENEQFASQCNDDHGNATEGDTGLPCPGSLESSLSIGVVIGDVVHIRIGSFTEAPVTVADTFNLDLVP